MPLPDRQYFSLQSLAGRWGVTDEDIRYYVEHGELEVCCWLDLREVMRYLPQKQNCAITCESLDFEGYVKLRPRDCRKVFRCGKYKLILFNDLKQEDFEITLTPRSRDALISVDNIVVSKKERTRFEKQHDIIIVNPSFEPCKATMLGKLGINGMSLASFSENGLYINRKRQEYYFRGKLLHLGPIQSNIIDQLADVYSSDTPWLHGKTLLHKAGSEAMRMRDLFKSQPTWREVIESDKRGHYRIFEHIKLDVA
jgi:hypothetical protein